MKYPTRIYYTEADKSLMWDRWQKGESLNYVNWPINEHCNPECRTRDSDHIGDAQICLLEISWNDFEWIRRYRFGGADDFIFTKSQYPEITYHGQRR